MVTYTVHEPPTPGSDRVDRGVELEFVKDGFSWLTAICPALGFLANSLWLFAIAYLVVASALAWALTALKVDPQWIGLLFLMINIYLGFEISTLKRWMLEQNGWQSLGVVTGLKLGTTTITASAEGKSATAAVTVVTPIDRIELTPAALSFASLRETQTVTARVVPKTGASVAGIVPQFSSSNPAVAAVDASGKVSAVGNGSAYALLGR